MPKIIDMTGWIMKEHGVLESRLTVLNKNSTYKIEHNIKKSEYYWDCKCECGKIFTAGGYNIRSGAILSCGCLRNERSRIDAIRRVELGHINKKDLTGKRYGKLTVLKDSGQRTPNKHEVLWLCQCDCGNTCLVKTSHLEYKRGTELHKTSCGCIISKGEERIKKILEENNINFKKEYTYNDLISPKGYHLRYDFYINDSFLLEYDGIQHFQEWKNSNDLLVERQERDKLKNEYAKSHNIPLKRIPYWDLYKITLENIMDDTYLIT